jgi:hypothetical protein
MIAPRFGRGQAEKVTEAEEKGKETRHHSCFAFAKKSFLS